MDKIMRGLAKSPLAKKNVASPSPQASIDELAQSSGRSRTKRDTTKSITGLLEECLDQHRLLEDEVPLCFLISCSHAHLTQQPCTRARTYQIALLERTAEEDPLWCADEVLNKKKEMEWLMRILDVLSPPEPHRSSSKVSLFVLCPVSCVIEPVGCSSSLLLSVCLHLRPRSTKGHDGSPWTSRHSEETSSLAMRHQLTLTLAPKQRLSPLCMAFVPPPSLLLLSDVADRGFRLDDMASRGSSLRTPSARRPYKSSYLPSSPFNLEPLPPLKLPPPLSYSDPPPAPYPASSLSKSSPQGLSLRRASADTSLQQQESSTLLESASSSSPSAPASSSSPLSSQMKAAFACVKTLGMLRVL